MLLSLERKLKIIFRWILNCGNQKEIIIYNFISGKKRGNITGGIIIFILWYNKVDAWSQK